DTYRDISENLWRQIERQEITLDELKLTRFSRLCEAYERKVDQGMERRYEQLLATHGDLIPDALEVIQHLSTTYHLSLITNGMPEITLPRLKQSGINTYFQHIFISETMGVQKPDPAFFEIVLETLQTEREDCLIIGDSLTSDIAGGLASHIDTCLVKKTSKRFSQP